MIPNIDSKPTMKPFKDVSGIFVTVNFDGNYLTWVKIQFEQKCLDYFDDDIKVTDPTNVNMKVEF